MVPALADNPGIGAPCHPPLDFHQENSSSHFPGVFPQLFLRRQPFNTADFCRTLLSPLPFAPSFSTVSLSSFAKRRHFPVASYLSIAKASLTELKRGSNRSISVEERMPLCPRDPLSSHRSSLI